MEVGGQLTLSDLLVQLALPAEGLAVAVNRAVIPRDRHPSHRLVALDQVEIIRAVGGG
jgi:sulfur carrier protein